MRRFITESCNCGVVVGQGDNELLMNRQIISQKLKEIQGLKICPNNSKNSISRDSKISMEGYPIEKKIGGTIHILRHICTEVGESF